MLLDVLAVVEIHEHRRILQQPDEQIAEPSRCPLAEHLVLPHHHAVVADLVLAGGEVTVPEERQLFLERPLAREHAVRPPETEPLRLDRVRIEAVEELVDDALESALRARRQYLLAEPFATFTRQADGFGAAGWK